MTDDKGNLEPQTLSPNALILGELKPSVFVRWIDLAMDLGPLDYKPYKWEELEERWGIGKKPVQKMVRTLEAAGWLSSEPIRDGVRIYLFPTNNASESHLKHIKSQTEDAWKVNTGQRLKTIRDKQPYRNQYMVENGNFTKVPETILQDQRFTNMQLATYVVIRCTTNAHSFWSERALAKAGGMALSTFTEHLKTLKEAGYIVYDGVQRVSNRYDFNDMPESLSVQMESLSVQPEPVSVQMESPSVPINTEHNTEARTLTITTDPTGVAGGQSVDQEDSLVTISSTGSQDLEQKEGKEGSGSPIAANAALVLEPVVIHGRSSGSATLLRNSVEPYRGRPGLSNVHESDGVSGYVGSSTAAPLSGAQSYQERLRIQGQKNIEKARQKQERTARARAEFAAYVSSQTTEGERV
ncbi:hypothetical protein OG824_05175 [Streptomyces prunicolor]|uniref:hypothetical protein n=1 Tax=Streptomyces prunicolor TaxID=67348 RepID=UPI002257F6D0|nr:hypothetical protein [Streptomyces prunicolor]MCX5234623.1 hypothetical protein [Streptomyces prunicolor]